jgi:hypothetical protein
LPRTKHPMAQSHHPTAPQRGRNTTGF